MKLWNSNTWTNTLNLLLYRECCKASFICCFLMTAKNLIWLVLFLFFCSWWLTKEYLLAVLNIMYLLTALGSSKLLQRSSPNPTTVSLYLPLISDTIQQTNLKINAAVKSMTLWQHHKALCISFDTQKSDSLQN